MRGTHSWPEEVQDEPQLLERGLRELGWPEREIVEFSDRVDARAPLVVDGLAARIRRALGMYHTEAVSERTVTIHVPVFRFGTPRINGARVVYEEAETTARGRGIVLKVFGVGTGASTTLAVERTNVYVAEAGDCKVVYIPIQMRLSRVRTVRRRMFVGEGTRAEVVIPKAGPRQMLRGRGCMTLRRHGCTEPGVGTPEDQIAHDFSRDASGAVHEITRSWTVDYTEEIALAFRGTVEIGPRVKSMRKSAVTVSMMLPAGHEYRMSIYRDRLWWETPTL